MTSIFYTNQISLPATVRFADCSPIVYSTDQQVAYEYLVNNYPLRSAWKTFTKGPTPPPFYIETSIENNTASYSIYFNAFTGGNCDNLSCNLQCLSQTVSIVGGTGNSTSFNYCPNDEKPVYNFQIEFTSDTARETIPSLFTFTFTDSLGNSKEVNLNSISYVKPIAPNIVSINDNYNKPYIFIGIIQKTANFTDLSSDDITSVKIQKTVHSTKVGHDIVINYQSLTSEFHNGTFKDANVLLGETYSYRMKFKNKYNEESQWSEWTTCSL